MIIEKVGRNRVGAAVSSLRQLDLGEEKMGFREEVVFHRLKIRSKTTNTAEIDAQKVREGIKTPRVRTFLVLSPDRDSEAAHVFTILITFFKVCV